MAASRARADKPSCTACSLELHFATRGGGIYALGEIPWPLVPEMTVDRYGYLSPEFVVEQRTAMDQKYSGANVAMCAGAVSANAVLEPIPKGITRRRVISFIGMRFGCIR